MYSVGILGVAFVAICVFIAMIVGGTSNGKVSGTAMVVVGMIISMIIDPFLPGLGFFLLIIIVFAAIFYWAIRK